MRNYLAAVVLEYKNLTSKYTIPKKTELARRISEIVSMSLSILIQVWYQFTQNAIGTIYI